jgi:hypothetical protein
MPRSHRGAQPKRPLSAPILIDFFGSAVVSTASDGIRAEAKCVGSDKYWAEANRQG